jgi:hypothetical protein
MLCETKLDPHFCLVCRINTTSFRCRNRRWTVQHCHKVTSHVRRYGFPSPHVEGSVPHSGFFLARPPPRRSAATRPNGPMGPEKAKRPICCQAGEPPISPHIRACERLKTLHWLLTLRTKTSNKSQSLLPHPKMPHDPTRRA